MQLAIEHLADLAGGREVVKRTTGIAGELGHQRRVVVDAEAERRDRDAGLMDPGDECGQLRARVRYAVGEQHDPVDAVRQEAGLELGEPEREAAGEVGRARRPDPGDRVVDRLAVVVADHDVGNEHPSL